MQLNTLHPYRFDKEEENFFVRYSLSFESPLDQRPAPLGNVWLIITIDGITERSLQLSKPFSLLRQPKEIVEIVVQREAWHYIQKTRRRKVQEEDLH